MSSIGDINSATYAVSVDGIGQMLDLLPDNLDNQITARNVRDVVYTLFEEIQAASASQFFYSNPKKLEVYLGNWTLPNARGWGGTFSNVSLKEMFDNIFYKDSVGSATLAFDPSLTTKIEYKGLNSAAYISQIQTTKGVSVAEATVLAGSGFDEITGNFGFSWTATKGTYDLEGPGKIYREQGATDLELYQVAVGPNSGLGSVARTTKLILNVSNSYYFTFKDSANQTITSNSVSVSYANRQYIGVTNVNTIPSDDDIRKLALSAQSSPDINNNGFTKSGGFESLKGDIVGHGGGGKYLIIVTTEKLSFLILEAPAFFYNEYQKDYTNIYGYKTSYYVYISIDPYTTATQKYKII